MIDPNHVCFCPDETNHWRLESATGTLLGGPFSAFDELLNWAIAKEFVEPKIFRPIIDEHPIAA